MVSSKRKLDSFIEDDARSGDPIDSKLSKNSRIAAINKRQQRSGTAKELLRKPAEATGRLQSAVVITSFDEPFTLKEIKIPELKDDEILVKNKFVGLNPVDWKGLKFKFGIYSFPWIQGRESSGIVHKLGKNVKRFKEGDEVFIASTAYRDLRTSTFQAYTIVDSRLVWKLPETISLEQGSALGVGLVTASSVIEAITDFEDCVTNQDSNSTKTALVWGASSGVGSYVIQLLRIAGYGKIIAVASDKHKDHLQKIGASHQLDRFLTDKAMKEELKRIAPSGIDVGVDAVGKETSDKVIDLLSLVDSSTSKLFVGVVSKPSEGKRTDNIIIKDVVIKKFHEDKDYGSQLVERTTELLENGKLIPQTNFKRYKGFGGIIQGLKDLEQYGASNEKYIVEL